MLTFVGCGQISSAHRGQLLLASMFPLGPLREFSISTLLWVRGEILHHSFNTIPRNLNVVESPLNLAFDLRCYLRLLSVATDLFFDERGTRRRTVLPAARSQRPA